MSKSALLKACELMGGQAAMAREFRIKPASVSGWLDSRVPAERCPDIERLTGGAVRCEDLRPDVDWAFLRATDCATPPAPMQEAA